MMKVMKFILLIPPKKLWILELAGVQDPLYDPKYQDPVRRR